MKRLIILNNKSQHSMDQQWQNRALALAGAIQALDAIDRLATTGFLQQDHFNTAVYSLFQQHPESVASTFGNAHALSSGLKRLIAVCETPLEQQHHVLLKYGVGIMSLQKKVSRRSDLQYIIRSRIEQLHTRYGLKNHNPQELYDDTFIQELADVYVAGLKPFKGYITVLGNAQYLQQERVAQQIRILLLAAIRAIWLWRQSGGNRWQLLFNRQTLKSTAIRLELTQHPS